MLDILPVNDPPTLQPTNDFVINEGDIELIRLSRFVDSDPDNATRKFLVIKVAWD